MQDITNNSNITPTRQQIRLCVPMSMQNGRNEYRLYFTASLDDSNKLGQFGFILIGSPERLDVNGKENQQKRTVSLQKPKQMKQNKDFAVRKLHTIHSSLSTVKEMSTASLLVSYC